METLFILTAFVVIINILYIISHVGGGSGVSFPEYKWISPHKWFIAYPSFLYQIWWWTNYFELF